MCPPILKWPSVVTVSPWILFCFASEKILLTSSTCLRCWMKNSKLQNKWWNCCGYRFLNSHKFHLLLYFFTSKRKLVSAKCVLRDYIPSLDFSRLTAGLNYFFVKHFSLIVIKDSHTFRNAIFVFIQYRQRKELLLDSGSTSSLLTIQ